MTIDITIPVLNEEKTIRQQIAQLHRYLCSSELPDYSWRIIVADNGSSDKTTLLAMELAKELGNIHCIQLNERGVGLALQHSWSHSDADIVGYMDLDLATDLSHLIEAYHAIVKDDYDLVYGSRLHQQSKVYHRSFKREVTSRVFNKIVKAVLGTRFSDGMCGFKWLKRSYLDTLCNNGAQSKGWFFSTELLAVGEWHGLKILELPIIWRDSPEDSKVHIPKLAVQYIKAMFAIKKKKPI
jgi:glycosyltransferase involved in cell wall biosynthesis